MNKTTAIFEQSFVDAEQACFQYAPDEDVEYYERTILISHETWRRLGCPVEITVTIEPGDTLNPPPGSVIEVAA